MHRESTMTQVRYPDGNVLLRNLNRDFPMISHGKGIYLYDTNGNRYLDAVSGALVVSVGHGNQYVVDRIASQLSRVAYINGTQFTSMSAEVLAGRLSNLAAPLELNRCAFLSSGSEAVEAAIKFARQLAVERGEVERTKLIARNPSYHGNTLYALSASGRPHYKKAFGPLLKEVSTVSAPYQYRFPSDYHKEGADHYARELEVVINREGGKNIFAFILEPIMGSAMGAAVPPAGYYEKIQAVCRKYGILMVADEVLVGCGRTGTFFASEPLGLKPDMLVLGKGINGGYAPLSVLMVKDSHLQEMKKGTGNFMHAQTFLQAPCMTAAGLAVLEFMEHQHTIEHAAKMGELFHAKLQEQIAPLPNVGCINGKGLLAGIEFVDDKKIKAPYPRAKRIVEGLVAKGFEKGLTLWPNVGHVDGTNGDLILVGPPLIISAVELDELIGRLKECILETFQGSA
ncbi:MAG: aminotransferase class III-fold pyridoxal phosphate-dependent enzyme [Deltaproteobacteria bacterium]|nr:aminotransferase class III-fold pyridoxal phosphate-dependent enzyme [Deltaproteobacteria bacterium]